MQIRTGKPAVAGPVPAAEKRRVTRYLPATPLVLGALLGVWTTVCSVARPAAAQTQTQTFKILSLTTNNPLVRDIEGTSGDDAASIAASGDRVFYTGNSATGVFPYNLSSAQTAPTFLAALTSDLLSGRVYSLGTSSGAIDDLNSTQTVTQLLEVDGTTGALSGTSVALSTPITMAFNSGVFAGLGRIVIVNTTNAFSIDPTTGTVTNLGAFTLTNNARAEDIQWTWGVAEFFNSAIHVAYVSNTGSRILRARVPDNVQETITSIELDSQAVFTVAPFAGRWFEHNEGGGAFARVSNFGEVLGSGDATFQLETVVTNTNDSGTGSLREVITLLNRTSPSPANVPAVTFALPGGPQTITLLSPLPTLNRAMSIDATTLPGFNGTPLLTLDGSSAGAGANGLTLASSGSTIRGLNILNFAGAGIAVASGNRNLLTSNTTFNNGGIGIDLGANGPTPNDNDTSDADTGANDLQNAPVLSTVSSSGSTINGTLNSRIFSTFTLQFFSSAQADPSGFGEGQTLLATQSVTTNGFGVVDFSTALPAGVASGQIITATATDAANNTSEFSNSVIAGVGSLAFSAATATVLETAGNAVITVTRTGDSGGAVAVDFATSDGTATAGSDYTSTSGTLSFADGETSKIIVVPILNDALDEANETLTLTLSNPTNGAILGVQSTLTLTISEDDAASGPPRVSFSSPRNGEILRTLVSVFGTVQDDEATRVQVTIQREADGRYFTGRDYSPAFTLLTAVVSDGVWTLPLALTPRGLNLRDGKYNFTVYATDASNNTSQDYAFVRIDGTPPRVSFTNLTNGAVVTSLPLIAGRAVDPLGGTGATRVLLFIKRSSTGKFFNGRNYSLTPTPLETTLRGTTFTRNGSATQPLPAGTNLPPDTYFLTAVAFDAAGNRSSTTITIVVSSTRPTTAT